MTREEAIMWLIKPARTSTDIGEIKEKEIEAYNMAIEALQDRPTGRWVRSGNTLICPICGAKGEDIKDDYCFNYCPNCGADMRKGEK